MACRLTGAGKKKRVWINFELQHQQNGRCGQSVPGFKQHQLCLQGVPQTLPKHISRRSYMHILQQQRVWVKFASCNACLDIMNCKSVRGAQRQCRIHALIQVSLLSTRQKKEDLPAAGQCSCLMGHRW